jgi:diacylglycerol kinase
VTSSGNYRGPDFQHRNWLEKFRRAGAGVCYALQGSRRGLDSSWKIHLPSALLAIVAGFYFNLERWEWAILVMVIGFVIVAEFWNTAFEFLARSITSDFDPNIQKCLDIAAGGVLVSSWVAVVIAVLLFVPHFLAW